jgi:hypothetical protein
VQRRRVGRSRVEAPQEQDTARHDGQQTSVTDALAQRQARFRLCAFCRTVRFRPFLSVRLPRPLQRGGRGRPGHRAPFPRHIHAHSNSFICTPETSSTRFVQSLTHRTSLPQTPRQAHRTRPSTSETPPSPLRVVRSRTTPLPLMRSRFKGQESSLEGTWHLGPFGHSWGRVRFREVHSKEGGEWRRPRFNLPLSCWTRRCQVSRSVPL